MSILEIELTPEMEQRLREKAKRRGLEAKAYVQTMVMQDLQQAEDTAEPNNGKQYDVMDFYGIGRETWAGIDVQQYINDLRNEWDK